MTQASYKAIFFDLDGTLLPMELDEFMKAYFGSIGKYVSALGADINSFKQGFEKGVSAMATHDGSVSNAQAYWDTFFQENGKDTIDWFPLLNSYYGNEFGEIGKEVVPNPSSAQAIEVLREKGYPLVLATMPMFPLRAVEWRLEWAGVDSSVFERITHYENSTSVKPKLTYYQENLTAAGLEPNEVLMVGNNTKEDLACLELGMDAFLITDCLLNPHGFDISTVKHGTFAEFLEWAKVLPNCEAPASFFETGIVSGTVTELFTELMREPVLEPVMEPALETVAETTRGPVMEHAREPVAGTTAETVAGTATGIQD